MKTLRTSEELIEQGCYPYECGNMIEVVPRSSAVKAIELAQKEAYNQAIDDAIDTTNERNGYFDHFDEEFIEFKQALEKLNKL